MNRNSSLAARSDSASSARARLAVALLAGLTLTTLARAAPQLLNARQHPRESSTFALDFGDAGGERQADISTTQFQLEVDAQTGTARFVNYLQHIDPLLLPGDINTGDITVVIEPGPETGSYDAATGVFTTTDTYAVYFEEDLSQFGLQSPVRLVSTSSGEVAFTGPRFGRIDLNWAGEGLLGQTGIAFNYTCQVATVFGVQTTGPAETMPAEGELRANSGAAEATDDWTAVDEAVDSEHEEAPTAAMPSEEAAGE